MDIADKIKFLRTNILDLSQDKFAKKIDVTRATINFINTNNSSYYNDCPRL